MVEPLVRLPPATPPVAEADLVADLLPERVELAETEVRLALVTTAPVAEAEAEEVELIALDKEVTAAETEEALAEAGAAAASPEPAAALEADSRAGNNLEEYHGKPTMVEVISSKLPKSKFWSTTSTLTWLNTCL